MFSPFLQSTAFDDGYVDVVIVIKSLCFADPIVVCSISDSGVASSGGEYYIGGVPLIQDQFYTDNEIYVCMYMHLLLCKSHCFRLDEGNVEFKVIDKKCIYCERKHY